MCAVQNDPALPRPPALAPDAALFIDVDGTLLEIAPQPELVLVPQPLPALLQRLARRRGGALALISGRPIADLDRLLRPWHGAAAGLHGAERRRPDGSFGAAGDGPADRRAAAALARLRPQLLALAAGAPGLRLEDKGRTLALHYRAAPERAGAVRAAAERALREAGDCLRLIAGKMVIELQPRHIGKDRAIAAFLAEPPFRGRLPVFLGDDTTDEDGFAEVNRRGGLSVRIGEPRSATAAACALPSVAAALDWLAAAASG
jgi:trehalose 6-phosphate phosphatase